MYVRVSVWLAEFAIMYYNDNIAKYDVGHLSLYTISTVHDIIFRRSE
jgi:hypothetical protein